MRYVIGTISFVFMWCAVAFICGGCMLIVFPPKDPYPGTAIRLVSDWRNLPGMVLGFLAGFHSMRASIRIAERRRAGHVGPIEVADQLREYSTPLDLVHGWIFLLGVLLFAVVLVAGSMGRAESWGKHMIGLLFALMGILSGVNAANAIMYGKLHGKHRTYYKARDPESFREGLVGSIVGSMANSGTDYEFPCV